MSSKTFDNLDSIISDWGYEEVEIQVGSKGWFKLSAKDGLTEQTYNIEDNEVTPDMANYSA